MGGVVVCTQMNPGDRETEADMYPGQRQGLSGVSVSVSRLPALSRPHHTGPVLQHLSRSTFNANTETNTCVTQIQTQTKYCRDPIPRSTTDFENIQFFVPLNLPKKHCNSNFVR